MYKYRNIRFRTVNGHEHERCAVVGEVAQRVGVVLVAAGLGGLDARSAGHDELGGDKQLEHHIEQLVLGVAGRQRGQDDASIALVQRLLDRQELRRRAVEHLAEQLLGWRARPRLLFKTKFCILCFCYRRLVLPNQMLLTFMSSL